MKLPFDMPSRRITILLIALTVVIVMVEYIVLFSPLPHALPRGFVNPFVRWFSTAQDGNVTLLTSPMMSFPGTVRSVNGNIITVEYRIHPETVQAFKPAFPVLVFDIDVSHAKITELQDAGSSGGVPDVVEKPLSTINPGDRITVILDSDLRIPASKKAPRTAKQIRYMDSIISVEGSVVKHDKNTLIVNGTPTYADGTITDGTHPFTVILTPETFVGEEGKMTEALLPDRLIPDTRIRVIPVTPYPTSGSVFTAATVVIIPGANH